MKPGVIYTVHHSSHYLSTTVPLILLVLSIVPLLISHFQLESSFLKRIICAALTTLIHLVCSFLFQHYHYKPSIAIADYGLPAIVGSLALHTTLLVSHLAKRYAYLIARGWTEKEKVARRRHAQAEQVEDEMAKKVSWREASRNIARFVIGYEIPESLFRITEQKDKIG
jgi:hypothetical protein